MTDYLVPLRAEALRQSGIPAPWSYGYADMVRFHEIDNVGHVNNVIYLRWFETARVRYRDAYGVTAEGGGPISTVIHSLTCRYLAPMFLEQSYIVTARTASFRTTSSTQDYAVWVDGRCMASGTAVLVLTNADGSEKLPLSEAARRAFVARDGAEDLR